MDLGSLEDDHTIQTLSVSQTKTKTKTTKFPFCGKVCSCAKLGRETHSATVLLDVSS